MAQETLAELKYNGKKVISEIARRDALGRTINTTYATKDEIGSGDSVIDLSDYPLDTTTNIPTSVLQPLIDKLTANEPPSILFTLSEGMTYIAKNYVYTPEFILVNFSIIGTYASSTIAQVYTFRIVLTTGNVVKSNIAGDSSTGFPTVGYLVNSNELQVLTGITNNITNIPYKSTPNIFTAVNTFKQGVKIGNTTLDEAKLTEITGGGWAIEKLDFSAEKGEPLEIDLSDTKYYKLLIYGGSTEMGGTLTVDYYWEHQHRYDNILTITIPNNRDGLVQVEYCRDSGYGTVFDLTTCNMQYCFYLNKIRITFEIDSESSSTLAIRGFTFK